VSISANIIASKKDLYGGLHHELKYFASGPLNLEALLARSVDSASIGDLPTLTALARGTPVKIVAVYAYGGARWAIVARNNSGIATPIDLGGKKVGVETNSGGDRFLLAVCRKFGIDVSQIERVNLKPTEQVTALQLGQIDACSTFEPYPTLIQNQGTGYIVVTGENIIQGHGFILVRNETIARNPQALTEFVKGIVRASQYIYEKPEECAEIIAEYFKMNIEDIKLSMNKTIYNPYITDEAVQDLQETAQFLYDNGVISEIPQIEQYIDRSFCEKAKNDIGWIPPDKPPFS
jgi:aliphatic sulfonates family ABC transporter substrate-binding protein